MEKVKCNLCDSYDYQVVYSMPDKLYFKNEWFTVVECKKCGLGFVNPRPNQAEIVRYYPPDFYDYFDTERDYHESRYKVEAKFISDNAVNQGSRLMLDIGCANGDFPRYMQKLGWQVEGVEVSPNSKRISDFKVYTQEFTQIAVNEARYDVITAWAVLEHVHDPMAYFRKVATVLKSGGLFIFLVTNFKSISSKALFREDVPRHLYFFTEETVKTYLSHFGFELIKVDYSDKVYSMRPVNWLRYYYCRYIKGHLLEWEDIPPNRVQYLTEQGFDNNLFSNFRYVVKHPVAVVDRLLMPLFEKYQMISNNYGIVTYSAIKP